jgi:hypothetical protein
VAASAEHERAVLQAGGVVIRYGQFYGPGTYYETDPPPPPRVHVDDAADGVGDRRASGRDDHRRRQGGPVNDVRRLS